MAQNIKWLDACRSEFFPNNFEINKILVKVATNFLFFWFVLGSELFSQILDTITYLRSNQRLIIRAERLDTIR